MRGFVLSAVTIVFSGAVAAQVVTPIEFEVQPLMYESEGGTNACGIKFTGSQIVDGRPALGYIVDGSILFYSSSSYGIKAALKAVDPKGKTLSGGRVSAVKIGTAERMVAHDGKYLASESPGYHVFANRPKDITAPYLNMLAGDNLWIEFEKSQSLPKMLFMGRINPSGPVADALSACNDSLTARMRKEAESAHPTK